jgi:hypothetical protein
MKSFITHESYYSCDCGSEVLVIRQFNTDGIPDSQIELSLFSIRLKILNWRDQLRWCWNIIRNKEIWCDQIILNKEEVERLISHLTIIKEDMK